LICEPAASAAGIEPNHWRKSSITWLTAEVLGTERADHDHDARDPRASPLYGALAGLPPVRIDVGDDELLLSDSLRDGDASANAEVHVCNGMPHVFTSQLGVLLAADRAITELTAFVRKHLQEG